ncbi:MAG TPA: hypothetical protein PLS10_04235 [Chitinophagales bacterium]|nr:hypothetical protein [Chitinophagales bacterium]
MNFTYLYFYLLLMAGTENVYQKAEVQANSILSAPHESVDSFSFCDNKIRYVVLKDSVINKKGSIGTEYDYPIYKYITEIIFYKDMKIAAIERKQVQLKRYEYDGVTTGMQISATLDSAQNYYFDQQQNPITYKQLLEIQSKICKEKE